VPIGVALQAGCALIVRAPQSDPGTTIPVVAGIGVRGSGAPIEFWTNPKYLAILDRTLPKVCDRRILEPLIQTNLVNMDWAEPSSAASDLWRRSNGKVTV
jgi:hypothetical protein